MPRLRPHVATTVALLAGVLLHGQGTPPAAPLELLSREGRKPLPTVIQGGQELIALDDVAAIFRATVREDPQAGGIAVSYDGRTALASTDRAMASVEGRLVTLPSPAVRAGNRWLVPVEFISRALGPIYDQRIDLRRASRLLILGDLRVPRVTARVVSAGPPSRVVLDISPAAAATATPEAGRVVVQIEADAIDAALPVPGAGLVEQIRTGDRPATIAVLLRGGTATTSMDTTATGVRISIDIADAGGETAVPAPEEPAPEVSPPFTVSRGALETIVLDAGHGGEDRGAAGPGGTQEKTVTLDVARRARTLIENRLGIRVLLTREDDRASGLDERAAFANNSKADLFISLHANATVSPTVSGAEVFYLAPHPEMEEARRHADAESVTLPVLGGGARKIDVIRWDMAQAGHLEASARLASILEAELRQRVPLGPRPVQRAPVRVLAGVNMPAALVEMAYLTNPAQERRAASAEFQTAVAQAIYETVVRFRAHLEASR